MANFLLAIFILTMITAFCWIMQVTDRLINKNKNTYEFTKLHFKRKERIEKGMEKCDNAIDDPSYRSLSNPFRIRRLSGAKPDNL